MVSFLLVRHKSRHPSGAGFCVSPDGLPAAQSASSVQTCVRPSFGGLVLIVIPRRRYAGSVSRLPVTERPEAAMREEAATPRGAAEADKTSSIPESKGDVGEEARR